MPKLLNSSKLNLNYLFTHVCIYYIIILFCNHIISITLPKCENQTHGNLRWPHQIFPKTLFAYAQEVTSEVTPSILLISPQSFKVPTNPLQGEELNRNNQTRLQQYVAVINNAQSETEDQLLRQKYKKLSLQVRDAKQPSTGQLFYEHVFDYFAPNQRGQHLLIPISLDQVSPKYEQIVPNNNDHQNHRRILAQKKKANAASYASVVDRSTTEPESPQRTTLTKPQELVISIRPYQQDSNGGELVEFVSSAPILVEPVPSSDGRRSFSIVQTDKPVYKPDDKVKIRALVINENLRPIVGDEFKLQIRNPHQKVVEEIRYPRPPLTSDNSADNTNFAKKPEPLFLDHSFEFAPESMLGIWSVHLLHNDPIANDTTNFELREYVLPPYEIAFELPKYILPSTPTIIGSITAKYHYSKPVQGKVQFKFGVMESPNSKPRYIARSGIKTVEPSIGRVDFRIGSDKFKETEWFPAIAGSRLVIEATVTEASTGHRETAQDVSCIFVTAPYRLSFENSIVDFKPDIGQQLTIQLVDSLTHQPGPAGEKIIASYWDKNKIALDARTSAAMNRPVNFRNVYDTESTTDHLGRAVFNIGPVQDDLEQIQIGFKVRKSRSSFYATTSFQPFSEPKGLRDLNNTGDSVIELASGWHVLNRHDSQDGWIHLMNKTVTHLSIGDEFESDVLIRDASVRQKILYTITSRGQIIALNTLDSDGLIRFKVTESMVPSIRLVLMLLRESSPPLSDSMRINVGHNMDCGLSLEFLPKQIQPETTDRRTLVVVRPNDAGKLLIQARQGDLVSLIGVDSAVYTLNNRSRLDASRIVERIKRLDSGCGFGGGLNSMDVFHNAGLMVFNNNASVLSKEAAISYIGSSCLTMQSQLKYMDDAQMGYSKPIFAQLDRLPFLDQIKRQQRKKRDVDIESILRRYKDSVHRACCRLGTLEDSPHHRNCSVRTKIVQKYLQHQTEFKSCAQIYQTCCHHVFGEEIRYGTLSPVNELKIEARIMPTLQTPQFNEDTLAPNIGQLDQVEAHTLVRKDFRETWLFELVPVEDTNGVASLDVQLPHSITSWSLAAMALNRNKPMCLMPRPYNIVAYKEIFIQLSMPYKLVQGEQIDLVTKVFNYSPKTQDVLVYMYGLDDVCSEAEPGERSERKRVRIEKQSTQSVLFPMIPLKTGKFPIKIVAVALDSNHSSDIVERQLKVVPRGKPVTDDETTIILDPLNQQRRSKRAIQTGNLVDDIDSSRGLQRSKVRLTPAHNSEYIVPQTHECIVSAIGDKVGQAVQTSLLDVENLIRLPHGCGEQVMIYLGPTLYTVRYLSSINKLTGDNRWRAIRYIQSGYKRILNFRKENGAFSAFARRDPSIWLTAFVSKLLCQTEKTPFIADEVHVDKTVINSALRWLIDTQNKTNGEWTEWNPVYHREMLGGALRQNMLTAFVTVTLNECAHHSADLIDEVAISRDLINGKPELSNSDHQTNGHDRLRECTQKAEQALIVNRLSAVKDKNPYVLALVANALSHSNPHEAILVLSDLIALADKSISRNQMSWRGEHQIETAAYALQAIIATAPYVASREKSSGNLNREPKSIRWPSIGADATSIANWLSSRRSYSGAFESTQDTVVALEALSKYAQLQSAPIGVTLLPQTGGGQLSLFCNVTVNNRTRRSLEFGDDNSHVLQTFKLDSFDFDSELDITTSGSGYGSMSVKLKYNVFQEEEDLCRFNIDSSIEEWQPTLLIGKGREHKHQINENANNKDLHLPIENQANDSIIEDNYFKTFDKSMLNELNLAWISQTNEPNEPGQQPTWSQTQQPPSRPSLRLRRQAQELSLAVNSDSWTTKMVSTLRSKLPSWMISKSEQRAVSNNVTAANTKSHQAEVTTLKPPRRNATLRRSAQLNTFGGGPLVSPLPTGMPTGVHLNTLSNQLEISAQNKSSSAISNSTTASYHISSSELSHRLVLLLRICVHHMARRDSEMSVIEVGVLSGFKPNEADLKEIINDPGTPAMKYELSPDRSLVIIYMQYIPNSGPYCLQFRLIRDALVYNLQSGYIRVYEYYAPRHSCSNFYTPSRVTDLLRTKCDSTGQVCQCASKSLCPATKKLADLGEIHQVNTTSARAQLADLICSNRFDLVSLVRLKSVKHLEVGKMFKLSVKVKSDLKGNLTKMIELQRQQKVQLLDSVRKPLHNLGGIPNIVAAGSQLESAILDDTTAGGDETSLDLLSMTIDSGCLRDDSFLLHLAHPSQWKQGGELILFAKSQNIERRIFRTTSKQHQQSGPRAPALGPRPKPHTWANTRENPVDQLKDQGTSVVANLDFDDSQKLQYSLQLTLDKNTILHDLTYQPKVGPREAINNLVLWLELRSRREKWACL